MVTDSIEHNNNAIAVDMESQTERTHPQAVSFSVEGTAYIALIVFVLLLRLAELDTVPLSDSEIPGALSAWHVIYPDAPGESQPSNSPITYWTQMIAFSLFGDTEFASRIFTVIGSLVLVAMPYFFRDYLGRSQSFLWSLLLALSPIGFVAARLSDPVIWSAVFALAGLLMLWRHHTHEKRASILWAAAFFAGLLFLSEPGGIILGVILLLAGIIALWLTTVNAPLDLDIPGDEVLVSAAEWLRGFPWQLIFGVGFLVVMVVSTGFMFMPSGLGMIGELLGDALAGIMQPQQPETPVGVVLLAVLTYEPLLLIFATAGILILFNNHSIGFVERFVIGWLIVAAVAAVFYRGAGVGHGLWLILPLTFLASYALNELVKNYPVLVYWVDDGDTQPNRYWWVKWMLGASTLLVLLTMAVHIQEVARVAFTLPSGLTSTELMTTLQDPGYVTILSSGLWVVFTILITIIGFFLAASLWGNANTWQGLGFGLLMFMVIANLTSGWNTAVEGVSHPGELWHLRATDSEARLLRETLLEIADRDTKGFPLIEVTVLQLPEHELITEDGLIAWLLRDFPNARFVTTLEEAKRDQIVIIPADADLPDLAGSYVGQTFSIYRNWEREGLGPGGVMGWYTQRLIREETIIQDVVILWLRLDVYDSIPLEERPAS